MIGGRTRRVGLAALGAAVAAVLAAAPARADFVNAISIPGAATDLGGGTAANDNRLGGQFSDLYYDRSNNVYYGLPDRGPGGGLVPYETRVQQFTATVNPTTGAVGNFQVTKTIKFKSADGSQAFNGLNPALLNGGNKTTLGRSFDPEGFAVRANGNFLVSDEYGPSVYEFAPVTLPNGDVEARFVRAFTTPANLLPKEPGNVPNFVDGRPTITTGRQDNRGFEGLTISPDGSKVYAILQDPLVNEGQNNDGRRSRNVRIVQFDAATGQATAQYVYQLESITDINNRISGTTNDFGATNQGRSIGVSSITALDATRFLVIERDNRGVGVEDPTGALPVGTKRVYEIDITGATDVSGVSFAGSNSLPGGVTPVSKVLRIDLQAELAAAGLPIREKFEGLVIGPQLLGGDYAILIGTDNDFSVTQTGVGAQFDVYVNGGQIRYTPLGDTSQSFLTIGGADHGALPAGFELLPSDLYSFRLGLPGFVPQAVPEPAGLALLAAGAAGLAVRRLRRRP